MNNLDKSRIGYTLAAAFGLVLLFFLVNPFFVVESGYRGIVFNPLSGMTGKVYGEGIHYKLPFLERVYIYSIRKDSELIDTEAASKDLQNVNVKLNVFFSPVASRLIDLHTQLGPDYVQKIIPSISKESIKAVLALKTAEEIISEREDVSRRIRESITERARPYNLQIHEVTFDELQFSSAFITAIERKKIAQQEFEESKSKSQAAVEKARGEAEAARIINQASSQSPAFIELRKIEAQKEIAATLAASQNVVYLPSDTILMLDRSSVGGAALRAAK